MKTIAIVQSNYIPWKGYFDLIARVDELILYDDMQYTRRDWRNRNKIKTPQGLKWVTIPVDVKGKYLQAIKDTKVVDNSWAEKHFSIIAQNYKNAAYYEENATWLKDLYEKSSKLNFLSDINHLFIKEINIKLGIRTPLRWSSEFRLIGDKSERLAAICDQANATTYISGPAAKDYIEYEQFTHRKIKVDFMEYTGYSVYPQLYGEFMHGVTILDLILNVGSGVRDYMQLSRYAK